MKILLVSKETVDKTALIIVHKEKTGERDLGAQAFKGFHAGTPILEIRGGTLELRIL